MSGGLELGQAIALTQQESRKAAVAELDPSKAVAFVDLPNDSLGRYVRVSRDGSVSDPITPPPSRLQLQAQSLSQFAAVANLYQCRAVIVSDEMVTGFVDPADRRDSVYVPLPYHPEIRVLQAWLQRATISQEDLVRKLRLELGACLKDDSAKQLLRFAEGFRVTSAGVQQQQIKRERESLGRSIESEVQSDAGNCPEVVIFSVKIHKDSALQADYPVAVRVDFSPSTSQFFLLVDDTDYQRAIESQVQAAMLEIHRGYEHLEIAPEAVPPIVAAR